MATVVKNELAEMLELIDYLTIKLGAEEAYEAVQISGDLDIEYELINNNQESTPMIIVDIENTVNTKVGAKGTMLAGETAFAFSIIVAKNRRDFLVYYGELVSLQAKVRDVFQMYPDKRVEFVESSFLNDYLVGDVSAVAVEMIWKTPVRNFDYTIT